MNRRNLFPLWLGITLAVGILLGYLLQLNTSRSFSNSGDSKISQIMDYVAENYVDSVSLKELQEKAITGMLEKLDPHSAYISAEEFAEANDPLMGEFEGIGVQFRIERDTIQIVNVIPNGPSSKKGILAGDRIVKVDGKNVANVKITNKQVLKLLKGKKGTKVIVGIFRKGVKDIFNVEIIRDVIPLTSIDAAVMLDKKTGFVRLNAFNANTSEEFHNALEKLKSLGAINIILDLRDNGGGVLEDAIEIADEFLPAGDKIVYTKGLNRKKREYKATDGGLYETGKIVVLINEFSASASEIVSGAIQDNDRGLVVGRRSFGKGLVQEQIKFKDGSAVRLTVARYYTPSGRCIQRAYDGGSEAYYMEFYESLMLSDSAALAYSREKHDSLKYTTKKGRTVYGGGGILPDSLVMKDFDFSLNFNKKLRNTAKIFEFIFDYADINRKSISSHYSAGLYVKNFVFPLDQVEKIISLTGGQSDSFDNKDKQLLSVLLKAYLARELYGYETYFAVLAQIDNTVKTAISLMH